MSKRTSFLIYIDHMQAVLPLLSMEERGELLTALTKHAADPQQGMQLSSAGVEMAYRIISGAMDANYDRYDKIVEKRRAAARSRYSKDSATSASKSKQVNTRASDTDTDTKTVTDTDTDTDTDTKTDTEDSYGINKDTHVASTPKNAKGSAAKGPGPDAVRQVREAWNALGLGQVTTITADTVRGKQLNARLKQHGIEAVLSAIEQIRHSSFLQGQSSTGWIVTFDWFVKPTNFLKVLEGNYSDHADSGPKKQKSYIPEDWMCGLEGGQA